MSERRKIFDLYQEYKSLGPDGAYRIRLVLFWIPITIWYWEV